MVAHNPTIFALSSGSVPAGVAVIRLSGPHSFDTMRRMTGELPAPRAFVLRGIHDPASGDHLDTGLVAIFPGPASFTGEDCAELHVHGSRAVVARLLDVLSGLDDHRLAEAGEFTRRAFINGKMDLTGAEALADLINAETEAQRRLALQNSSGAQFDLYSTWRSAIIAIRAQLEAQLDFADEDDVPESLSPMLAARIGELTEAIGAHVQGFAAGEMIRDGFRVVIAGAPNAGKSSLLNALARRDVAIVSPVAGTTRDVIDVQLDLRGIKVVITDTAGLRDTDDIVETIGVERARAAMTSADLVIALSDRSTLGASAVPDFDNANVLRVASKADLTRQPVGADEPCDLRISAKTGEGIADLLDRIEALASNGLPVQGAILPTRQRHKDLLVECMRHLATATDKLHFDLVLAAEEARLAGDALGRLTGQIGVEDVLDVLFKQFCIGK